MCATGECHGCSILADLDIDAATREAHDRCLMCDVEGCKGCPAGSGCELPRLVEHANEYMCPECCSVFDAFIENRAGVAL